MVSLLKAATARPRKPGKRLAAQANRAARQMLLQAIQELELHAHGIGMTITGRVLNNAKNAAVWELAGNTDMAAKAARGERAGERS